MGKIVISLFLAILAVWIATYSVSYWAARGWYDGKGRKHG